MKTYGAYTTNRKGYVATLAKSKKEAAEKIISAGHRISKTSIMTCSVHLDHLSNTTKVY